MPPPTATIALLLLASARLQAATPLLDLDADKGLVLEEGDRVASWANQAPGTQARLFLKQDKGRKEPGSGRPTLRTAVSEINGHAALVFRQQELVCPDEDTFDRLTTGEGCTWIAILAVDEQRLGLKDVNSFFGNLRNGGKYEGVWGNVTDDNTLWWGARNGLTFGRFDANNPQILGPKLDRNRFHLVAGRIAAGTGTVQAELFVNSAKPAATAEFPVNAKANPSRMAVGQERDAVEHPGHESFDGEISRLLIFSGPLPDDAFSTLINKLRTEYGLP